MLGCQREARSGKSRKCTVWFASGPRQALVMVSTSALRLRGSAAETIMDSFPQKTSIKAAANSFSIFVIFRERKRGLEKHSVEKALPIQARGLEQSWSHSAIPTCLQEMGGRQAEPGRCESPWKVWVRQTIRGPVSNKVENENLNSWLSFGLYELAMMRTHLHAHVQLCMCTCAHAEREKGRWRRRDL